MAHPEHDDVAAKHTLYLEPKYINYSRIDAVGPKDLSKALWDLEKQIQSYHHEAKEFLYKIKNILRNQVAELDEPNLISPYPNIIILTGPRGSGKTTILTNLYYNKLRNLWIHLNRGNGPKPLIVPMPIVYPSLMPRDEDPISWLLASIDKLLDKIKTLSDKDPIIRGNIDTEALYDARNDLESLVETTTILTLSKNEPIRYTVSDIQEYFKESSNLLFKGTNFKKQYKKLADNIRKLLHADQDTILLYIIDDLDTEPEKLYETLEACKLLSTDPYTLCIISIRNDVDINTLITLEYIERIIKNTYTKQINNKKLHKLINTLVDNYIEKVIPKHRIVEIKPKKEEIISFTPYNEEYELIYYLKNIISNIKDYTYLNLYRDIFNSKILTLKIETLPQQKEQDKNTNILELKDIDNIYMRSLFYSTNKRYLTEVYYILINSYKNKKDIEKQLTEHLNKIISLYKNIVYINESSTINIETLNTLTIYDAKTNNEIKIEFNIPVLPEKINPEKIKHLINYINQLIKIKYKFKQEKETPHELA
ncbi:MAG: KAP family NTPase, partial [Desulfurococcales archaeon]|nr:KAP family NTPase [Desulfurococcales archaeon]